MDRFRLILGPAFYSAVIGLVPLIADDAHAGFKPISFCNEYSMPIRFAIAYRTSGTWVAQGWRKASPGTCVVIGDLPSLLEFYWRAETDPYVDRKSGQTVRATWGKDRTFSVRDVPAFSISNADAPSPGTSQAGFYQAQTSVRDEDLAEKVIIDSEGDYDTETALTKGQQSEVGGIFAPEKPSEQQIQDSVAKTFKENSKLFDEIYEKLQRGK